jgi:hypothetical protein
MPCFSFLSPPSFLADGPFLSLTGAEATSWTTTPLLEEGEEEEDRPVADLPLWSCLPCKCNVSNPAQRSSVEYFLYALHAEWFTCLLNLLEVQACALACVRFSRWREM